MRHLVRATAGMMSESKKQKRAWEQGGRAKRDKKPCGGRMTRQSCLWGETDVRWRVALMWLYTFCLFTLLFVSSASSCFIVCNKNLQCEDINKTLRNKCICWCSNTRMFRVNYICLVLWKKSIRTLKWFQHLLNPYIVQNLYDFLSSMGK